MKRLWAVPLALAALLGGGAVRIVQDQCGPFTDVTPAFCPFILELYYLGVTAGTSATTYSPDDPLTRGQGAVFVAKGVNQALARSSRRAALGQWWNLQNPRNLPVTQLPLSIHLIASDGSDVWVAGWNSGGGGGTPRAPGALVGAVFRVRGSDGKLLETWTLTDGADGVLVAMGRVFATSAGNLYMLDPAQAPGDMTQVAAIGDRAFGIAFDGSRIWTTNNGSVSIVTPASSPPWSVTTVSTGFQGPLGALFDGSNVWVTDFTAGTLLKLDSSGAIVQTVQVGSSPAHPVFDGSNIWVPNVDSKSLSVVAASTGQVLATLTGNGLDFPYDVAFDGRRILALGGLNQKLSLWNAADLSPLGSSLDVLSDYPTAVCSDGVTFFVAFEGGGFIRF